MRSLTRAPGFSALAIAVLATGIAAAAVMYTLVEATLLRALPFEHPDRLVWMYNARTERDRAPLSFPDLNDYRRDATTLAGLAVFTNWTTNLTGSGSPERLDGTRVSGNFFELLGTTPLLGRLLQPDDEARESRVAVLTYGLWRRRFGGDPALIGRDVTLNGAAYTIVGILQPRFLFPFREAELAVPISLDADPRRADRGANFLRVVARLKPGVAIEEAKRDLDSIAHRLQRIYPDEDARKTGISLYPLHGEIVRDYRRILWMLFGSVGVLLLAGCVNIANLLLVRALGRQTEFAIRRSLGASRARLVRQVLGETATLASIAGGLGLVLANAGVAAWKMWGPADFPQMADLALDRSAVFFVIVISGSTALACGIAPAWFAAQGATLARRDAMRAMTNSRAQRTVQRAFLAGQVAAATVLLSGMLLMARGLSLVQEVAPGFTPSDAVSLQLSLPPGAYNNREALTRFVDALRDRLREVPGVDSAGTVSLLPLSGLLSTADVAFPDRPAPPPDEVPQAHLRVASPEYFGAAGITVLEGRPFDVHDRQNQQPVAIVSRTFASRHWPGQSAVGRSVSIVQGPASPRLEVVGVVNDVKQFSLDAPATADLYLPFHQMPAFQAPMIAARMYWVLRTKDTFASTTEAIRSAVARVDPAVAASSVRTLESLWLASMGPRRANVRLLQMFGNVALLLCALGVYGVAAFNARTRRRELAIRAALGATRRELTISLLVHEARPVITGLGCGLVATLILGPFLFAGAFATSLRDSTTYFEVATVLLAVSTLAGYLPLRRAAATSPSEALTT